MCLLKFQTINICIIWPNPLYPLVLTKFDYYAKTIIPFSCMKNQANVKLKQPPVLFLSE